MSKTKQSIEKNKELQKVKKYFKEHPEAVKYDRKISGLASSYIKDQAGLILRLANKSQETHILGLGAMGRVKNSESVKKNIHTATKVQGISKEIAKDSLPAAKVVLTMRQNVSCLKNNLNVLIKF